MRKRSMAIRLAFLLCIPFLLCNVVCAAEYDAGVLMRTTKRAGIDTEEWDETGLLIFPHALICSYALEDDGEVISLSKTRDMETVFFQFSLNDVSKKSAEPYQWYELTGVTLSEGETVFARLEDTESGEYSAVSEEIVQPALTLDAVSVVSEEEVCLRGTGWGLDWGVAATWHLRVDETEYTIETDGDGTEEVTFSVAALNGDEILTAWMTDTFGNMSNVKTASATEDEENVLPVFRRKGKQKVYLAAYHSKSLTYQLDLSKSDYTKGTVQWKSSDKDVARVSKKGKVSAENMGTATITATLKQTGQTIRWQIVVNKDTHIGNSPNYKIYVGTTEIIKYEVCFIKGWRQIKWKSSNKKIATISGLKVTAKKAGKCTISGKKNGVTYKLKVVTANKKASSGSSGNTKNSGQKDTLKLLAGLWIYQNDPYAARITGTSDYYFPDLNMYQTTYWGLDYNNNQFMHTLQVFDNLDGTYRFYPVN